jgi:hypothetical protein
MATGGDIRLEIALRVPFSVPPRFERHHVLTFRLGERLVDLETRDVLS